MPDISDDKSPINSETPGFPASEKRVDETCKTASVQPEFADSELVIGLVGAVGTNLKDISKHLNDRLAVIGYSVEEIHISQSVIQTIRPVPDCGGDEFKRISAMMDAGNDARSESGDNSILALGVAALIASKRALNEQGKPEHAPRKAYIIRSLKHPEEVAGLRKIYPQGFYLIGVHCDDERRRNHLVKVRRIKAEDADKLMRRDEDEHLPYGQQVRDTFHMSDFFVRLDENDDRLRESVYRILNILFRHPYTTPTFDEYAMFLAFAASLRSADLSRQVGAVVARLNEILSTGANDCPRFGGGLYWPEYDKKTYAVQDQPNGRDYLRGYDFNRVEQLRIIGEIVGEGKRRKVDGKALEEALGASRIQDLTEFSRAVHAEMEALLSCGRNNISTRGATLYSTTFPCHNCAKHIIASGIVRVVYIEPYPKSKTAEFHSDAVTLGFGGAEQSVHFEPFVGIGPRRFFDLFSMKLGSGSPLKRKNDSGSILSWQPEGAILRIQMLPCSYLDLETVAAGRFNGFRRQKRGET